MSKKPRYTQPGLMDPPNKGVTDPAQQQWQNQLTQVLKTGLGQSPDNSGKFLTWTDLETEGIVTTVPDGTTGGGTHVPVEPTIPPVEEDRNPPPAPVNLRANGAMTAIYITWDDPKLGYDYRIEIHKAAVDDVGFAVLAGSGYGTIFEHIVGSDRTLYYFWARFVRQLTNDIIIGPWNQTEGTPGQASEDPQYILDQVSGRFDTDDLMTQQFNVDLFGVKSPDPNIETFAFVVDTTTDPPYVAMDGAFIVNATITDAQIANLNVDKLVGGTAEFVEANILDATITNAKIGNVIQSVNYATDQTGWILNKDGYFEAQNAYIRGRIVGSEIIGSVIQGSIIIGEENILIATEADQGPGSTRFLTYIEPFKVSKEHTVTIPQSANRKNFTTDEQTVTLINRFGSTDIVAANFTGQGESSGVWINHNRYRYYGIRPEIKLICNGAWFSRDYNENDGRVEEHRTGVYKIDFELTLNGDIEITDSIDCVDYAPPNNEAGKQVTLGFQGPRIYFSFTFKTSYWIQFEHSGPTSNLMNGLSGIVSLNKFDFSGNTALSLELKIKFYRVVNESAQQTPSPQFSLKMTYDDYSWNASQKFLEQADEQMLDAVESILVGEEPETPKEDIKELVKYRHRLKTDIAKEKENAS